MSFAFLPTLEGELVGLIPARAGDFEPLFKVASDPLIWEQHPQRHRYEGQAFRKFFDDGLNSTGMLLISDRATGELIGTSRFYDFDPSKKWVAIGYTFLARAYWGGRYNWDLKRTMLHYAFDQRTGAGDQLIDSVILHVGEGNMRSRKASEKLGAVIFDRTDQPGPGGKTYVRLWYQVTRDTALPLRPNLG